MEVRKTKTISPYETPRLRTYGKLQELTRGSGQSGMDASAEKEP